MARSENHQVPMLIWSYVSLQHLFMAHTPFLCTVYPQRGYDTVDCRCTFGVVFPFIKGRQLRIRHSDSQWPFSTNRILVTQITTAQMAQIEVKWDLITKT